MAPYRIVFKKSVAKDLKRIPKKDVSKILKVIRSLADNPRPPQVKKLSGQDRYRMRQKQKFLQIEHLGDVLMSCGKKQMQKYSP